MVIEQAAEAYVKAAFSKGSQATLKAMQIEYLSAVKGPNVEVVCEELGHEEDDFHVRVLVKRGGRVAADGKLRFSASSPRSKL